MRTRSSGGRTGIAVAIAIAAPTFSAQEYKVNLAPDHPAIQYATRPVLDRVARLAKTLEQKRDDGLPRDLGGYLPALLERFDIAADSQMLVFSKTSLQASHISPQRPRAIYFTDDIAVAYIPGAATLELTAVDPAIGPVFYTVAMNAHGSPSFVRSTTCLRCHQGPNTEGVPGVYVGSVIPGPTGAPLRGDSAIITDHRTPFKDRWGGWYVTARRGEQQDRANAVASDPAAPDTLLRESQQNLVSLAGRFPLADYLAPTSDIVALMTFEHQTQMVNLITRVAWEARMGREPSSIDDLVDYMLFTGEQRLAEPLEGVSTFARTFAARGPRDRRGRSLREFDLTTRLFRYPLSYMIYSDAFEALPEHVRVRIYRRVFSVLSGAADAARYSHLAPSDRKAILDILLDTKGDLPAEWVRFVNRARAPALAGSSGRLVYNPTQQQPIPARLELDTRGPYRCDAAARRDQPRRPECHGGTDAASVRGAAQDRAVPSRP
jgi:hypothetical protein